jgi:hypothetical protein
MFPALGVTLPYPFLPVVDDCGFRHTPNGFEVPIDTYRKISLLGRRMNTVLPCAFTTKYLEEGNPNSLDKLTSIIQREHGTSIEFAYHGHIHDWNNESNGEFLRTIGNSICRVPEASQYESFRKSWRVIDRLNLPKPRLFIPSYNLWEKYVTDKVASKFGITCISSPRYVSIANGSARLDYGDTPLLPSGVYHVPRKSIGILSTDLRLGSLERIFVTNSCLRKLHSDEPQHNVMTHIGNYIFMLDLWTELFNRCMDSPYSYIPRDSRESFSQWLFYKQMRRMNATAEQRGGKIRLRGKIEAKPSDSHVLVLKSSNELAVEGHGITAVEQGRERKYILCKVRIGPKFDICISNTR